MFRLLQDCNIKGKWNKVEINGAQHSWLQKNKRTFRSQWIPLFLFLDSSSSYVISYAINILPQTPYFRENTQIKESLILCWVDRASWIMCKITNSMHCLS
jgi:hypothetical protein